MIFFTSTLTQMGFLAKFINYTYFADGACRHAPERVHNVDSKQRNSVVCVIKLFCPQKSLYLKMRWENTETYQHQQLISLK